MIPKLGDAVASIATPIARALNLPCVDPLTGQLNPESECAKRKAAMNRFSESVYDIFNSHKKNNTPMQYIVTKNYVIEDAENAEDAIAKSLTAPVASMSANVFRPQGPLPAQQVGSATIPQAQKQ